MNTNLYQILAKRTLLDKPDHQLTDWETMLLWNATGVAGEGGELLDHVKKIVFHQHPLDDIARDKLVEELGDVLWYIAACCTKLGLSMEGVMAANLAKLKARYPVAYSAEDSLARADKQ